MTTIQALVDRFLAWPVPAHVRPDGIPGQPGRTGTNLLDADVARQMLEHLLGTPAPLWAVAKQHPDRPDVSMFTTSHKATAQDYERLGWTVRLVETLPPADGVRDTGEGPPHG